MILTFLLVLRIDTLTPNHILRFYIAFSPKGNNARKLIL